MKANLLNLQLNQTSIFLETEMLYINSHFVSLKGCIHMIANLSCQHTWEKETSNEALPPSTGLWE